MTLYLTSDLHADHYVENRNKISTFINRYLPFCDVLCVAGDTADNPKIFIDFYRLASVKYKHIFLIFGNHDLTVKHDNCFLTNPFPLTEEKLNWIKEKLSELQNVTLLDGTTAKIGKITTTRQTGGLLLAYKAKGLKPRLKSHAFTYVQAYCSLSPAGP